jgi:hypothetical protein
MGNAKFCPNCGTPAMVQTQSDPAAAQRAAEEQAAAQKAAEEQAVAQRIAEEQAAAQKAAEEQAAAQRVAEEQAAAQKAAEEQAAAQRNMQQPPPQRVQKPAPGSPLNINGPARILIIVCAAFAALGIVLSLILGKGTASAGLPGGFGVGKISNPAVGNWIGKSVEMSGVTLGMEAIGDMSLNLKEDGSCEFTMDGEKTTGKWSFAGNTVTIQDSDAAAAFSGSSGDGTITATLDGDTLTMEDMLGSGMTVLLAREGSEAASVAVSTSLADSEATSDAAAADSSDTVPAGGDEAVEQERCREFNGDWYGVLEMTNATGDYEYMEGMTYAVMRVSIDPADAEASTDVFLSAWLTDPASDFRMTGLFGDDGQLMLYGTLWNETLDDMVFEKDSDYSDGNMYSFTTALNNDSGSVTMKFYLEKWNEPWVGKGSLAFTEDDTDFFRDRNIREVVESGFGLDSSALLPENDIGTYSTEEDTADTAESDTVTGTEEDDSGESISYTAPSLAAFPKADLKKIYDKLQNVPTGTSYEDIRDKYFNGVDGQILYDQDGITQYWWGATEDPSMTGIIVMVNSSDNTYNGLATQWNLE